MKIRRYHSIFVCGLLSMIVGTSSRAQSPKTELGMEDNTYENAKRTVCVLYSDKETALHKHEAFEPLGTGFWISIPGTIKGVPTKQLILVTTKHVLKDIDRFWIRINDQLQRKAMFVELNVRRFGPDRNIFYAPDPLIDLIAIRPEPLPNDADTLSFLPALVLKEEQWSASELGEGTEVFSPGLLMNYPGLSKNFPVLRFGRLALISPERWYKNEEGKYERALLASLAATSGTSGSPVMLVNKDVTVNAQGVIRKLYTYMFILGVIKGAPTSQEGQTDTFPPRAVRIPLSLTAIEPANSVLELIDSVSTALKLNFGFIRLEQSKPDHQ